jgi:hypothetical protein
MVGLIKQLWLEALGSMDLHLTARTAIKEWSWTSLNTVGAQQLSSTSRTSRYGSTYQTPGFHSTNLGTNPGALIRAVHDQGQQIIGSTVLHLLACHCSSLSPTTTPSYSHRPRGPVYRAWHLIEGHKWLEASGGALHKILFRIECGVEARVLVFFPFLSGCGTTMVVHMCDIL